MIQSRVVALTSEQQEIETQRSQKEFLLLVALATALLEIATTRARGGGGRGTIRSAICLTVGVERASCLTAAQSLEQAAITTEGEWGGEQ